jgi:hypothetical protein
MKWHWIGGDGPERANLTDLVRRLGLIDPVRSGVYNHGSTEL